MRTISLSNGIRLVLLSLLILSVCSIDEEYKSLQEIGKIIPIPTKFPTKRPKYPTQQPPSSSETTENEGRVQPDPPVDMDPSESISKLETTNTLPFIIGLVVLGLLCISSMLYIAYQNGQRAIAS